MRPMTTSDPAAKSPTAPSSPHPAPPADAPLIHRVCISCNNMFLVPASDFEAKHCPACHKP